MGITHLSKYLGNATRVLAQSANPTSREDVMYLTGDGNDKLEDGDIFYDTDTNSLKIYIGARWVILNFGI